MNSKLTPEQMGQVKDMIAQGKTNKEIQDHFQSAYKVKVQSGSLWYLRNKDKPATKSPGKKRPAFPEGYFHPGRC